MVEIESVRPLAAVLVSLVAVVVVVSGRRRRAVRDWTPAVAALCKLGIVLSMVPAVRAGRIPVTDLGGFVPGVEFALRADPLGLLFAAVAATLWLATAVYGVGYARGEDLAHRTRFNAAFCLALGAAMGVAFASNLLVLLVFYELTTVGTYPLVAHASSDRARRVGYEYVAYVLAGGTAVFAGIVLTFLLVDTTTFSPGGIPGIADAAAANPVLATAALVLLVAGFGVKAAILPVHGWLPDAMVAPTPVSGVLHAVVVVKSGVFGIARTVLETFGPEATAALGVATPLAVLAATTVLVGGLLALRQDDLKARLAYSTVAHLSYVVLGVALLSPVATAGGLLHLATHAVGKLTLFFCVGVLAVECGVKTVSGASGVGRRMPVTMGVFAVAAASLAGFPLLAGFTSKWLLVVGGANVHPVLPAVFALSGVLNVAYFWPVVYAAFFETSERADPKPVLEGPLGGRPSEASAGSAGGRSVDPTGAPDDEWVLPDGRESRWTLLVPPVATGALVVLLGVAPGSLYALEAARTVAEAALAVATAGVVA